EGARGPSLLRWLLGLALLSAVAAIAFLLARRTADTTPPSFRPLTFQRGLITGARLGPDGNTVYYSATYGAEPSQVYVTRLDRIESRPLDLPPGFVLGVSAQNELGMLSTTARDSYASSGTLVRVPAIGGTPRPLFEGVTYADWAPDGERLAISRKACEFPVGHVIAPYCAFVRVSPRSDYVAISAQNTVGILDGQGSRVAEAAMGQVYGLAWAPDGHEVWFTGSETRSSHDRA